MAKAEWSFHFFNSVPVFSSRQFASKRSFTRRRSTVFNSPSGGWEGWIYRVVWWNGGGFLVCISWCDYTRAVVSLISRPWGPHNLLPLWDPLKQKKKLVKVAVQFLNRFHNEAFNKDLNVGDELCWNEQVNRGNGQANASWKYSLPTSSSTQHLSFEWSHFRIWPTDTKVTTVFSRIIKHRRKSIVH